MEEKVQLFTSEKRTIKSTELVEIINQFKLLESEASGKKYTELRHNDFMTKIKKLNNDTNYSFHKSSYINLQNKTQPCYELTKNDIKIIMATYKDNDYLTVCEKVCKYFDIDNITNLFVERKETGFGKMLRNMFTQLEIIEQFRVGKYEVDYYIPFGNLLIEYDEKEHNSRTSEDKKRESKILKELYKKIKNHELLYDGDNDEWTDEERERALNLFTFIRVKEGQEVQGLRNIMQYYIDQSLYEMVL